MSRRRPLRDREQHEHVFTQRLELHCPHDEAHALATVYGDIPNIRVYAAVDRGGAPTERSSHPLVPLRRDGERLRIACPPCARGGVRTDWQVRLATLIDRLDHMQTYGPADLRLAFSAEALRTDSVTEPSARNVTVEDTPSVIATSR